MARYRRRWARRDHRNGAVAIVAGLLLAAVAHAGAHSGGSPAQAAAAPASVSGNVALGQQLAASYGWSSGAQWTCLYDLWERESGWSNTATNPQSGAFGIAQALGHGPTNQYPAGPANPPTASASAQVSWGLSYIASTYGGPCGAWAHEEADGWY
jgi:hypothetical protein